MTQSQRSISFFSADNCILWLQYSCVRFPFVWPFFRPYYSGSYCTQSKS